MSFPDDLVRYLFGHLRASPALSPSPLTDIFAVLAPETIFREIPDIMQRRRAMRSSSLTLASYPPSLHTLILLPFSRFPSFSIFLSLRLSLHGNVNAFSLLISSLLIDFYTDLRETEMYKLFLKKILVISLPHSTSADIFYENEARIANAIVLGSKQEMRYVVQIQISIHVFSSQWKISIVLFKLLTSFIFIVSLYFLLENCYFILYLLENCFITIKLLILVINYSYNIFCTFSMYVSKFKFLFINLFRSIYHVFSLFAFLSFCTFLRYLQDL